MNEGNNNQEPEIEDIESGFENVETEPDQIDYDQTNEIAQLEWESLEYVKNEATKRWLIAAGVVFLAIIAFFIIKKDYFGAVFALIIAVCLYWYKRQKPVMKRYKITQMGLYADEKLFPYNTIHSFSVNASTSPQKLKIRFNKKYSPQLDIVLEGVDALTVKTILGKNLPELPNDHSIIDSIIRLLKIQ